MIKINGLLDIQKNCNLNKIALDIELSEEDYIDYDLYEKDFPKDSWVLWIEQRNSDSEINIIGIAIQSTVNYTLFYDLSDTEQNMLRDYIFTNNLHVDADILINENTRML